MRCSPEFLRDFSFTLLFPTEEEETAYKKFHDAIHLRVIRIPILLLAILCLPVALLQEEYLMTIMVFIFVCGPCLTLFLVTFTRFYQYKTILSVMLFISAEALIFSFAWLIHIDSAIVFYFVLHLVHLTAFLRFFHGCWFTVLFHISKIANDFAYHSEEWTALCIETLIEIIAHICFIFIAYKNERTSRNFFRLRNELFHEKQESEKLLLNTLPQQAIERLEQGEFPISDRWENATIVVLEVSFSEKIQSSETSVVLSEIFYILDELTTQYGLEKVLGFRGDEYVVISMQEKSCYMAARYSISAFQQINEYIKNWEANQINTGLASLRIGIGCSTIYGGIVGSERCTYDYWGEGLALVQKIITACPENTITISSGVQRALLKHGVFTFQPMGSVLVPPLGNVELFSLSDPTESTSEYCGACQHTTVPMNLGGEIFSSKRMSKQTPMNYDFNPTSTLNEEDTRLHLNKFTLRFSDPAQERMAVRMNARASLWQIRAFIAVWGILITLETIEDSAQNWKSLSILLPIVVLYVAWTFWRKFPEYSELALLFLSVIFGIQYIYYAYYLPLDLSFFIYPLFLLYLLPLRYTHACILFTAAYVSYALILCLSPILVHDIPCKVEQVIALFVVMITYHIAAYHVRERMRRLYIFTDTLGWSKQKIEQRLRVIIPPRIISLLRQGQYPIVYNFQDIGLGCVSITNMQTLTKEVNFNQLTLMLHNFHQCGDKVMQPGLDKIKTIGPLSLVAGGLPTGTHDDVDYMVMLGRWALGIVGILSSASKKHLEPTPSICVVLHFGEVFAGIAGTKKYRFDLWGTHMAKLQKTLEAVKILDQNAIYVTEEAYEVLGTNFTYKKAMITTAGPVYQLIGEASSR